MKRDNISNTILENIKIKNKTILKEMPEKATKKRTIVGYDFDELDKRAKMDALKDKEEPNPYKDSREMFNKEAIIDLKNRLQKIIPGVFKIDNYTAAKYDEEKEYRSDSLYMKIDIDKFIKYMISKFPNLERNERHFYSSTETEDIGIVYFKDENDRFNSYEDDFNRQIKKLRHYLSYDTNFDDLRRQEKVAINNYFIQIHKEIQKAILENKEAFESNRAYYDKYINQAEKERQEKLHKYWYDINGNVIRAKKLGESSIKESSLKESIDIEVEDYVDLYDFDELPEYRKQGMIQGDMTKQIKSMFDRMTEIIEELFTDYMEKRGLKLEPGNFDIETIIYNLTHKGKHDAYRGGGHYRYREDFGTSFKITTNELKSYFENNQDLVEKYGQDMIDALLSYTKKPEHGTPVFYLNLSTERAVLEFPWNLRSYEGRYYKGASKELSEMVDDLQNELTLDFYSSYRLLGKAIDKLKKEAEEILYDKIRSQGKKYENR